MRRALHTAVTYWAIAGGALSLLVVLVTVINVGAFGLDRVARLAGGHVSGLPGYEDFVRLVISCAALMFFPYCQLQRGHVAVDIFVQLMPRPIQSAIDTFALLLMASLAAFLGYWMYFGMLEARSDNNLSRILGWPEWPFYMPGLLSLLLWAAVAISQLAREDEHART